MAKTKSTGATRLGRDSLPKYLGIKLFAGEITKPGQILVRQRGTKFLPGKNVKRGKDDTLYALKGGVIRFSAKRKRGFNNSQRLARIVNVDEPR
jgi:large subunit ribosomal protein L27